MHRHAIIPTILLALAGCSGGATPVDGGSTPPPDGGTPPGHDAGETPEGDGGGTPAGWHAIELDGNERVTGIHCTSATSCVISTDGTPGHLYATDGRTITATILTGDGALGEQVGVLGDPSFVGFSEVGDRLIVHLANGGRGFVSATGDYAQPASWTVARVGSGDWNLNTQLGFGHDGTRWLQFRHRIVYATDDTPGPTAVWEEVWAPAGVPPVPADLLARRAADPTLCDSEPGYSEGFRPTQGTYVAGDLGVVIYPANALNQVSSDATGVCISTDGGDNFRLAPFAEVADQNGPTAITCTSRDHCVALGGQIAGTTYAYVTNDASMGAASTWTRATLPSFTEGWTFPRFAFFAPGGTHGWVVGEDDSDAFLWETTDGGATWTDVTSEIAALDPRELWVGLALDDDRILLGGEGGTLLASF